MNPRQSQVFVHFGPLFVTALGGWAAFHLVNSGSLYLVPGMIIAALLAYSGTLLALRLRVEEAARDMRHAATVRATGQFSAVAAPRGIITGPFGTPHYERDIAAGD